MSYIQAVKQEHKARKLRKQGEAVSVGLLKTIPVVHFGFSIGDTIEGCLLLNMPGEIYKPVTDEFNRLPEGIRLAMKFTPKPGTWKYRAEAWKDILTAALPPKRASYVLARFLRYYRKCVRMRLRNELL